MNLNCDQSELATSAQSQILQQMLVLASSPEVPALPQREANLSVATLPQHREIEALPFIVSRRHNATAVTSKPLSPAKKQGRTRKRNETTENPRKRRNPYQTSLKKSRSQKRVSHAGAVSTLNPNKDEVVPSQLAQDYCSLPLQSSMTN